MNRKQKILVFIGILCLSLLSAHAQDNEAMLYINPGNNTVYGGNCGISGIYTRHLTDRIDVSGGIYFSSKRKNFFSSLNAAASYRLPLSKTMNLYAKGKINWTNYAEFHLNEYVYRLVAKFESNYFDMEVGNCVVKYTSYGEHQTEGYNPSVGFNVRFNKLTSSWYAGLFLRNYDDFYFDNYNVIWGFNGLCKINKKLAVFGELDVQPAGNLSQLATKYAYYIKLGATYKW